MEPNPGDTLKLRIRTARENVSAVVLVSDIGRVEMSVVRSDAMFDLYEAALTVPKKNFRYYFIIWCGEKYYYYNTLGVCEEHSREFAFTIMPGFKTPDWAKGAVMYQIFTDRFANGDGANSVISDEYSYIGGHVVQVFDWNKTPAVDGVREFYGGDLGGVRKKLDHLKWMGVEVIYFNPLFVSPSNHKYDTQDYDHIDPHFTIIPDDRGALLMDGDQDNSHAERYIRRVTSRENLEESNRYFAEFMQEAHARGFKVILDGVFNHCGSMNKWMDREGIYEAEGGYEPGAYRDARSPYRSFFKFRNLKAGSAYEGWWGHDTLPKLNYEGSPKLVNYILGIARKWVSPPYNADGWRLDVAADLGFSSEFNHRFWQLFRDEVKSANPEAIIIAENYSNSGNWLQGGEWDTIMNYEAFMEPVTWFLTGMEKHSDAYREDMLGNSDAFFGAMTHNMAKMNIQSLLTSMNQLSNHDHSRFLTRTNHRVGRLANMGAAAASEGIRPAIMRAAIMMQMTWPGAPCIYYGDEAGVCGWTDPDNRRTYPWEHEDKEMLSFYKQITGLHRAYNVLKTGSIKFLSGVRGAISYGRFNDSERFVVAVNASEGPVNINIPVWEIGVSEHEPLVRLAYSDRSGISYAAETYRSENGVLSLRLEGEVAVILKNMPSYLM